MPIYGKGLNSREWIFVDDHCEALIQVSKKGKIGNFYNIGSNINLNNLKITKCLLEIAKSKLKIGKNVKVGAYSIIGPNVEIGEGSEIQSHVSIIGRTKIGKNNKTKNISFYRKKYKRQYGTNI